MEEKLRPGVFSSYSAGGQPGGWGRRFAGLIVSGVTAPGVPVWVATGAEAAKVLAAPEEKAALAACELLLATGAGKVWLCPVAEGGWQAAFDLAGAEAELDTLLCDCQGEAEARAFAAMLTNAAADRRERVGVIASAEDKAALALAAAVNCERVMIAAGSGIYQGCDAPLCLAAAVAGKLLGRSAPDESLSAAVLEELEAVSPTRTEPEIEALLRGGVVPAEWVGNRAECIRGVTTRTRNGSAPDSTWRDITTLLTVDHIMQAVRQMLTEKLRGVRSSQQSLESVASQVTVLLRQKEEEGLLADWSDPVVYTRPEDASVCVVELSFAVARVVSRITVTASITL